LIFPCSSSCVIALVERTSGRIVPAMAPIRYRKLTDPTGKC
jgi:hypothetical protein